MTNEELNTALYEKMFAEQQRYIAIRLGKEDGKWGLFTVLAILFLMGLIGTWLD